MTSQDIGIMKIGVLAVVSGKNVSGKMKKRNEVWALLPRL
jgi:hypothetical protein